MVNCSECGTENEKEAKFCTKCGATLEGPKRKSGEKKEWGEEWGEDFGKRVEEWGEGVGRRLENECFGIPNGGAILGLIFGAIIVLFGLSWIAGFTLEYFWPAAIIILGSLILIGALYGILRK